MTIITFPEIKLYGEKSTKCFVCGKRVRRRKKFYQTLNPFNKLSNGAIKSSEDIYKELKIEIDKWEKCPDICLLCAKSEVNSLCQSSK